MLLACTFSVLPNSQTHQYLPHPHASKGNEVSEGSKFDVTNVHPQRRKSKSVACTLDNKNSIEARKLYCYMVAIK